MNKIFSVLIGTVLFSSCQHNKSIQIQQKDSTAISTSTSDTGLIASSDSSFINTKATEVDSLMKFKDKYPAEVKLMENGLLKTRLETFLSCQEIREVKERMQTTTTIEVEGNTFFAQGCKAHDCSVNEAAIFINTRLDQVWVAIIKNKKINIKSDKAFESNPQQLQAWVDRFNTMQ